MFRRIALSLTMAVLAVAGQGCGGSSDTVKLQGAGSSFVAPVLNKWFKEFKAANKGVQVDYQSVGSGQGVKSFIDGTVDFGASDAAMTPEEIAKVDKGVVILPITAGSIVLAYNLEGIKDLKLSREAYTGIFLGKITKWNDPAIKKSNPDLNLPDKNINVIVRSDSSGTTYVFTKHLSAISPEFEKSPGTNKMPSWTVGTKSKGNEGVTASITTTPGSIGYVEYSFAKKLSTAALENKEGQYVQATPASGKAALASTEMPANLIAWLPDPAGKESYPIVTYSWLLCYQKYADKQKANTLKDVIKYCITTGQDSAEGLGYIPLPESAVSKIKTAAEQITATDAKASRPVPQLHAARAPRTE